MDPRRAAPVLVAALLATVYVVVSPPSLDLAAHLLRAKLFRTEGFGVWSNWWYQGHHVPGYSVLFPPVAAALTPQVGAALAATGSAAVFESWAREQFGPDAWLGSLWFGAATATNLFTGRLAFAFGLLPALGATWALSRRRTWLAAALGVLTALCSPVSALFAALAGAAQAVGALLAGRRARRVGGSRPPRHTDRPVPDDALALRPPSPLPGLVLACAALVPVGALAVAFPEGGTEPFTLPTLAPILAITLIAVWALPRKALILRSGLVLYALMCIASYEIPTPVGSNAARLGALVAGPLAALLWWRRRPLLLVLVALPLAYIQWQAPIRDVRTASGDRSASASYYRPLLDFLSRQGGPPFRVEIPFTLFHWEAYQVAPRFPLARGWERQLDIKYNHVFYGARLTPTVYEAWLHSVAVRFVAQSDARLDYSAHEEAALISRGLPGLRLVFRSRHWHVYEVRDPTPIASGAATLTAIGVNSLSLYARHPGQAFVRVHFTPYWALGQGSGCVEPAGDYLRLTLRRPGPVRLVIRFSLGRIRARTPRCS